MEALKKVGVDEVIVYCVNDAAVMGAWAKDQGVAYPFEFVTFAGDPSSSLTSALDMEMVELGEHRTLSLTRTLTLTLTRAPSSRTTA